MNVLNNFYIKVWLKAFALCCLVYSFLLTNFMWGNHDWKFLRKGVKYYNGFYELRFSHHSIAHLVLDGHLLPIITLLLSLMLVSLFAVIIAQYLNIPKKQALYLCFVLFICLNPHIFVIHYYLHYGFQVCFWAMVGVFGLNYSAQSKSLIRACLSGLLYLLVVGSYPPIFSLIIILFITKRLLNYIENKENFKTIFIESVYFLLQLFIMIIGDTLIEYILIKNGYVGLGMYNIKTKTAFDM